MFSKNSLNILEKRYLLKDKNGQIIETVEGLFTRVARDIASAETIYNPKVNLDRWAQEFFLTQNNSLFIITC